MSKGRAQEALEQVFTIDQVKTMIDEMNEKANAPTTGVQWYRKKPVAVRALQWTGYNEKEMREFAGDNFKIFPVCSIKETKTCLQIATLEGAMIADPGDFVIEGVEGEFYPCKPGILRKAYDLVEQ